MVFVFNVPEPLLNSPNQCVTVAYHGADLAYTLDKHLEFFTIWPSSEGNRIMALHSIHPIFHEMTDYGLFT